MTPSVPATLSAAGAAGGGGSQFLLFGFMLLLIIGMFWFSSRTRRKQQEKLRDQQRAMEPGMEVMTSYGLYGRLVAKDEEAVKAVIEIAPGTQVTVHLQTLTNVVERSAPGGAADQAPGTGAGAGSTSADEAPAGDPTDPRDPGTDAPR
ncbi:preprotein translocase subunit YajC [Kocuria palustris]|uniref:preprotein translocase subunit YajC n=1 Tax=Kocuria palustris TaxID=71999 RepID=UPI0011A523F8|nr:preprotein translocase subunit YajC [Kocuria palustris]